MASKQQERYIGQPCHSCNYGTYAVPTNGQEWHVVCNECNAIFLVYEPLPHQDRFHKDPRKFKMFAGGYGSGKTTTGAMETIDHILSTPGGTTLIGAETLPQLEQTAMKEFFEIFPAELIFYQSKQKNYIITENGHTVIFRPLDEEQKARSLNLTFFWIEEANGVNYDYFVQLQTRLRNTASSFPRGILTTNPDMNWVKTEFLLKADKIYNADVTYQQKQDEINKDFSVHIAPTHLNIYLPSDYYETTSRGKPDWWIRRYLEGSFENKEGLVYPNYSENIVDDFTIPMHWERRFGADFGLNNPTAFVALATDPKTGISYIYWTHKQAQKPVNHHAEILNKHLKHIPYGVIRAMVGDAAGGQKNNDDMTSTFDHYMEYGIYWQPSTKKLEDSIMKMFTYFGLGKLKIFRSCEDFIEEIEEYRYPERSLDKVVKNEDTFEKPIKQNDHLLDAARYIVAELPDDPNDLINESYNANFEVHGANLQPSSIPFALQEDDDEWSYSRSDAWLTF